MGLAVFGRLEVAETGHEGQASACQREQTVHHHLQYQYTPTLTHSNNK
jgi:hypothetical protein